MSIQSNFPNLKPSLLLDFASTKQLDNRITFTRSTPAVYYDGKTTAMAEQNLTLQSQTFDVSPWITSNTSVTANATSAPDGTTTADKIVEANTNTAHAIYQSMGTTSGSCTFSVYAKADTRSWLNINTYVAGVRNTWFDLTNGVVGTVASGCTATITSIGSGWYRCSVTTTGGSPTYFELWLATGNNVTTYSGDGTSGLFVWGAQVEQRSAVTAYTATTTQPITNYIPVLLTAGGNQARFDCNPTTGESLGLLIEEQRTNNVLNSQNFNNWTKYNCTVNNAAIISPSGSLDGNKLISSATTNVQTIESSNATFVSGSIYTLSVYAKAGEYRYIQMSLPSFVTTQYVNADLVSGTINGGSYISASITSVGNSWYRISFSFTSSYSGTTVAAGISLQTTVNPIRGANITGDGFSGLYIWGAQQELGSFPTSYIATTSASATRAADLANMTGANFTSWFNNAQGTTYVETSCIGSSSSGYFGVCKFNDGSIANRFGIYGRPSGAGYGAVMTTNGTTVAGLEPISGSTATIVNTYSKITYSYQVNNFSATRNASTVTTDTAGDVAVVNRFDIGLYDDVLNGYIKKLAYYPIAVTSANLQALTS